MVYSDTETFLYCFTSLQYVNCDSDYSEPLALKKILTEIKKSSI